MRQSPGARNQTTTHEENTVSDYDTPYDLAADQYANGDYEHDPDATITLICPVCEHMGMDVNDEDDEFRAFEFTGTHDQARKLLVDHLADIEGEDGNSHDNVTVAEYIAKETFR